MSNLKITIESDEMPEPMVIEREVVSWRTDSGNELQDVSRGPYKEYEIVGGSVYIQWVLAR